MKETQWVDICRVGNWIDKHGRTVTLTTNDFDKIVASYNPKEREAPLVFGHPVENGPAFGWVSSLRRAGEFLQAKFRQVSDVVCKLVDEHHYKKVSCALGPDGKTLYHVGLLGAVQPAVVGLRDVKFTAGDEDLVIELSTEARLTETKTEARSTDKKEEGMTLEEAQRQLEEEKRKRLEEETKRKEAETKLSAAQTEAVTTKTELATMRTKNRETELTNRLNKLVEDSRLLPKDVPAIRAVALALPESGAEIELSAGAGKKAVIDHLFDFLSGLAKHELLSEFSATNGNTGNAGNNRTVDAEPLTKYV